MIPFPFTYVPVASVGEAVDALSSLGDEARVLAGGQSLLPLMKLRLASPTHLVDVGRVEELSGVRRDGDDLVIGAMTRHAVVARSVDVRRDAPLLAAATALVGDPQVRNRGTIGGAVAHADPAGDVPCALLALGAAVEIAAPGGHRRVVPIDDFFTGFWTTALEPGEIVTALRVPVRTGVGWGYRKFTTRSQDWATVAVAVAGERVALASMAERPVRALRTEAALAAGASAGEAAALADAGTEPPGDLRGSAEYRRALARALCEDALADAAGRG